MPHASLLVIVLLARASALLPLASSQSRVGTRLRAATADGLGEWFDQRDVSDERLHVSSTPSLAGAVSDLRPIPPNRPEGAARAFAVPRFEEDVGRNVCGPP